ncbi:MAG: SO_0444 family Cu/Zn efflux transporter [bacterium]|nr:SO_0444 family Cu/Zn efflux transporter [bacterium]
MLDILWGILVEAVNLFNKMSFYLLFGFFFAGLLHIFLNVEWVAKHLGAGNITSVFKASILGIPLPLCSCGVVPTVLMLKKKGASKGAILSFLISTPTSGVDSIAATYSLLGPLFAVYRVIACGITGIFAGIMENLVCRKEKHKTNSLNNDECKLCNTDEPHKHTLMEKIKGVFHYAFVELLEDISKWLIIGILIGGLISYLIPDKLIYSYLGSGWQAMVIMLVVGIPLYICATGSIPIVAALILKGMSPGAGLVFLLAGPATNIASLVVLTRYLGIKTIIIYLVSISFCSISFGYFLDILWTSPILLEHTLPHKEILSYNLQLASSLILFGLIVLNFRRPEGLKKRSLKE